jgi:putative transport protein
MKTFCDILQNHPELAVFLILSMGFAIGLIRLGTFKIGPVLGTLFAGVLVGQIGIIIDPVVKIIFFDLFLFSTGYKVGPQFFRGLKRDALPQLALTIVICTTCLLTAFTVSRILGYDMGTAAGMLAGAFTESTVIGTAGEAIMRLSIPAVQKAQLINNIPVAYAVTYLIGTTTLVWFLSSFAPKLIRIDLRESARELAKKREGKKDEEPGMDSAFQEWSFRAFRVENSKWIGQTVAQIEKSIPGTRILIQNIRRNQELLKPEAGTIISDGDGLAVRARRSVMLQLGSSIGPETADKELLDFPIAFREIIVSRRKAVRLPLGRIASEYGNGIVLLKLVREGQEIPFSSETSVYYGDIMKVSGRLPDIESAARDIGFIESLSPATDMIFVGMGILLGGILGFFSLSFGGISFTLTTSGGALIMGLVFGWLHSKKKVLGRIPDAALWIFDNVGLAAFIGIVGLSAGPSFISGLRETGIGLIFAGLIVAVVPHIAGLLFGRYILKMHPVILLGAQSGAGTTTTALKAIQDAAGSKLPVLGYTIPYALGNILLTAWGPVIVAMMS